MKKQFFRVKQLADQTFSRVGKTEALSDDLQAADKKIEFIKVACGSISKRLSTSLLAVGQDAQAKDKRLKKCPEYLLALAMLESGNGDEDDLLRHILIECSKIQMCLANTFADYDARIESNIVTPLNQIVEVDVPNVLKQKRYLTKLILDMDSARNRYQTALKHNNASAGGSTTNTAKIDSIKDELEDVEMKVEQCRDALASEMFQIISRESEIAALLLGYIKHQQTCHKTALTLLNEIVPEIESYIGNSSIRRVFGIPLQEHLRITQRKIAYPVELCVCTLVELGMEEEGLFRVAGGASKVRRMKLSFDANCITWETALEYRDIHVVASVLKSYLRELPDPLLTHKLYYEWMAAIRHQSNEHDRLTTIGNVMKKLPEGNLDNLRYVIKFLSALTKNQDVNKMTSQNLAIVIAPNLIWSPDNDFDNIGHNMNVASQHTAIVEYLVSYADYFFPGDEPFYVTLELTKKSHTRSNSADISLIAIPNVSELSTPVRRTQSSDSLVEEQSAAVNTTLQGSPKPITRTRKSKPAPVPPVCASGGNATVNNGRSKNDNSTAAATANKTEDTDAETSTDDRGYLLTRSNTELRNQDDNKCVVVTCVRYDLNETANRCSVVTSGITASNNIGGGLSAATNVTTVTTTTTTTTTTGGSGSGRHKTAAAADDPIIETNDRRQGVEEPTTKSSSSLSSAVNDSAPFEKNADDDLSSSPSHTFSSTSASSSTSSLKVESLPGKKLLKPNSSPLSSPSARHRRPPSSEIVPPHNQEEVILRKPVIPERPASLLRPFSSSFRKLPEFSEIITGSSANNYTNNSDEKQQENNVKKGANNSGPSLERAHLYSVDKQQVSIIQVKTSPTEVPIVDAESVIEESPSKITEVTSSPVSSESFSNTQSTSTNNGSECTDVNQERSSAVNNTGCIDTVAKNEPPSVVNVTSQILPSISAVNNKVRPISGNFSDKKEVAKEKPERPPKPESISERSRNNSSSHMRAFSDGHNIDIYGSLPSSHRTHQRAVQRPLPPPPPPPTLVDKHRHNSMVDSTNL